ncbi:MAG: alpha/beta hydrolase [Desulfobacteraceae bacterium]
MASYIFYVIITSMKKNHIHTDFKSGGKTLSGILSLPPCKTPPLVVGSHGLEGSMESAKQKALAEMLPNAGMAFFRFDHRGCGKSQGDFQTDTSLDKRAEDMINAVDHALSLSLTDDRFALFGSSLGGSTCIETWHRLLCRKTKPWGMVICAALVQSTTIEKIPTAGNENRPALPMSFFQKNLFFDIRSRTESIDHILIFHGDRDRTVPVENGYAIYRNAKEPKKLIILKNGDHQMSCVKDQHIFKTESVSWFKACFS